MRITNMMMTNNMLLGIQKNESGVNSLYNQIVSGKKIQSPSENPIIASRTLKFRTNIAQTDQYISNTKQATSWMEVTEKAYGNVNEILKKMGSLAVQGASDTLGIDERNKIAKEIGSIVDQIGLEMNVTYAGRYVFSGYRTEQPPVFTESDGALKYNIKQTFTIGDMQSTQSFQKLSSTDASTIEDINVLKIAYENVENFTVTGTASTVNIVNSKTPDAYVVADDEIKFLEDTGEIILGKNAVADLKAGNLSVSYDKEGFVKGELNPRVYFECDDLTTTPPTSYNMDSSSIVYEVGVGTRIQVNSLAKDVYTDKVYADLKNFVDSILNLEISSEDSLRDKFAGPPYNLAGDELETAVNEQLTLEKNNCKAVGQDRFSDFIAMVDKTISTISVQHTDLGARMNRVDLISNRLEEDLINYSDLLLENEGTDYMEAFMKLSSQETIYNASMQIGARINQMSLVNYM